MTNMIIYEKKNTDRFEEFEYKTFFGNHAEIQKSRFPNKIV